MRYITLERLEPGMKLGKAFYGRNGEIMLQEGVVLTDKLLERVHQFQYSGLYIKDEFSEGITVEDIISDELRQNSIKTVSSLMTNVGTGKKTGVQKDIKELSTLLYKIVDEIIMSDQVVINMIDLKVFDLYTYQHSVNVCVLSCILGVANGLNRDQLYNLALAATLHDLGKTFIPKSILNKPGRLEPEEFEEIKKHPFLGYEYIRNNFNFHYMVNMSILQHHERHDGSGYPLGRKSSDISLFASIIAVVDVFDAITSKRPYHEPLLPSEAYEYIMGSSGQHFSPEVVMIFLKKIAPFPAGVSVRLSNGLEGIVFKNNTDNLVRPLIKLKPLSGQTSGEEQFMDLLNDRNARNVTIQEVLA